MLIFAVTFAWTEFYIYSGEGTFNSAVYAYYKHCVGIVRALSRQFTG